MAFAIQQSPTLTTNLTALLIHEDRSPRPYIPGSSPSPITLDTIRPLLSLTCLRQFEMESSLPHKFYDTDIETITNSWPELRIFKMRSSWPSFFVTLRVLSRSRTRAHIYTRSRSTCVHLCARIWTPKLLSTGQWVLPAVIAHSAVLLGDGHLLRIPPL
jgi:hypothetical protein